jgi:uracil-DNA glycosylase
MSKRSPRSEFLRLIKRYRADQVFNPWTDRNASDDSAGNGPHERCRRLEAHLSIEPGYLLIGEASGYQGCRISGIPFTSERLIIEGVVPRLPHEGARLSTRKRPWSEPSATIVWGTLRALGIAERTILWNAFPWHPHGSAEPHSNRTPSPAECMQGLAALEALLRLFPSAQVLAVGRHAERALLQIERPAPALRHPAMGGASAFRAGLKAALRR